MTSGGFCSVPIPYPESRLRLRHQRRWWLSKLAILLRRSDRRTPLKMLSVLVSVDFKNRNSRTVYPPFRLVSSPVLGSNTGERC